MQSRAAHSGAHAYRVILERNNKCIHASEINAGSSETHISRLVVDRARFLIASFKPPYIGDFRGPLKARARSACRMHATALARFISFPVETNYKLFFFFPTSYRVRSPIEHTSESMKFSGRCMPINIRLAE